MPTALRRLAACCVLAALLAGPLAAYPRGPRGARVVRPRSDEPGLKPLIAYLRVPGAARMFFAIVRGAPLAAGVGWYRDGLTLYDWRWLAQTLQRTALSPRGSQYWLYQRWMEMLEFRTRGLVTRTEWDSESARLRSGLAPVPVPPSPTVPSSQLAGPKLSIRARWDLMLKFFNGDLGHLSEGPSVGAMAPDFVLPRSSGAGTVRLSDHRGRKPVVLIFGSFT